MVPAPITPTWRIVAQRRVLRQVGDLAGGALGGEHMALRRATRACHQRQEDFALTRRPSSKGLVRLSRHRSTHFSGAGNCLAPRHGVARELQEGDSACGHP
jgi:hypothetical protein